MKGNQSPRIKIEPERVDTDGNGAAMLMASYGLSLDEWQHLVIDCWLGKDKTGAYTVTSAGLSCPRQNGKNLCIEAREFYGLVVNGERILHTAHQVRTYKKAFRRLAAMFEDERHPEIMQTVKRIRYGIGEESIELKNGGLIEYTARTRQAARGYDGISLVVYDEAQELGDDQAEAIMSVLSASATGTRQVLYVGTPPYIGCTGDVFRRFRDACIEKAGKGENLRSAWYEWSVPGDSIADIDIADKRLWYEANPALGYRLTEEFTSEEKDALSPEGFARERLGWYCPKVSSTEQYAIDQKVWESCRSDEDKVPEGKTALGIKFSADGSYVAVCGAMLPKEEKGRISLLWVRNMGDGITWLADWLNEWYRKASCVVIDGKNGAEVLIEKIKPVWKFKDSIIRPSAQNMITAASLLINELTEQNITWNSKHEALNQSALNATKRPISGGWGFGGPDSAIIEAASLALWGAKTSKRDPTRKMKFGSDPGNPTIWR